MRTGVELLLACEGQLAEVCSCGREDCARCVLRREVERYLDVALPRRRDERGAR